MKPTQQARSWVPLFIEKACEEPGADELVAVWAWMASLDPGAAEFAKHVDEDHPVLWWSAWMNNVEDALDQGSPKALDIALDYIIADPKAPFGKIHKRRVLKRLRRNLNLIPSEMIKPLEFVGRKFDKNDYKPQEYNDLIRLITDLRARDGLAP